MDKPKRYHPVHVTLHWLVALGVFFNLYLGIFVFSQRGRGSFQLQPVHMAVGITILVLLLVRLVMRFTVKRPADATAGHRSLDILAKVVHYGLYLTVLTVTVLGVVFTTQSGMLQVAFTGSRPEFNGPPPGFNGSQSDFNPPVPGEVQGRPGGRPPGGGFRSPLRLIHGMVAYLVALLLGIHILAALYHQFIRRDNLLARMWYGSR
jgi:cytochrome b561